MKLGFLSDAHGNYLAFLKAIQLLREQEVEQIYFLGDAIGYFDSPEVVYYIKDHNISAIRGNHEEMVITQSSPDAKEPFYRLRQHYDSNLIPIISSWPTNLTLREDRVIHMVHGSANDPIWGYTYENSQVELNAEWDVLICGATHRPFERKIGSKTIINVGSCGFPRDIGTLGSYGIYDSITNSFSIIRFGISDSIAHINSTHNSLEPNVKAVWDRGFI
jgi:putative phosphoesterase